MHSAARPVPNVARRFQGLALITALSGGATGELRKPATMTAPALADDLGGDRDGRFLRCTRPEIKADGAGQPSDLGLGECGVASRWRRSSWVFRDPMAPM